MQTPELGHYRPWIEDQRKDKPYQLEDRVEQLFHEKSADRLRRLEPAVRPDHLGVALQGRRQGTGDRADAEPAAGSRAGKAQGGGAGAGENLQGQRAHLCADHQYAGQGQGDFRSLARFPGRRGFPASGQPRRARGGRCAGGLGARGLSAAVASLLCAEGGLVQKEEARALGPQRAAAVRRHRQHPVAGRQEHGADGLSRRSRRKWPISPSGFSPIAGSMRRCGRQGAGRVLASDHAVGASLCADELSGQAARRDDARA